MTERSTGKLVPVRFDRPPRCIAEKFAAAEKEIAELWRRSSEFREVCRDYREAVTSLDRFGRAGHDTSGGRTRVQLEELVDELEDEIASLLHGGDRRA